MQSIKYDIQTYNAGSRAKALSNMVRLLLSLNSLPFFNKVPFLKKMLCKNLNVPLGTQFGKKFYCRYGNLKLGDNVSFGDTFIIDSAPVIIGNNVSFSYKNIIITTTHDLNNFHKLISKPVTIGDNVWITTGVIILPGVTIGSGTVIGAGSVVSKDIPSGVFAAGNPCKEIKRIEFKR